MDLTIFNETSLPKLGTRQKDQKPSVYITRKGAILFNRAASETLGLINGSRISFALDSSSNDWYLITGNSGGFQVRPKSKDGLKEGVLFSHAELANKVLDALKANPERSATIPIASLCVDDTRPDTFALFTSSAKIR
ncbi:hypothetical protein [Phaeocystidibacter marisrubri]|uniref:Uncharacterized protein n=1 Tax=Phaeocystidibacter marisrubri TaxID=1577780 RepID=A0A6L3ZGR4_9FLAO|nr:hypothetical protein [Phaeocystidibacter marisrubri]KAB2816819.1 hypothetical protein F8C82_00015 [Phaeocystidibacter marisrubri]